MGKVHRTKQLHDQQQLEVQQRQQQQQAADNKNINIDN